MVVDDDPDVLDTLASMLQEAGCQVEAFQDSREAARLIARQEPLDAAFLDIQMPWVDGFELTRQLRTSAAYETLPIFMVTQVQDDRTRQRSVEAGVNFYVTKPFTQTEILSLVAGVEELVQTRQNGVTGEPSA